MTYYIPHIELPEIFSVFKVVSTITNLLGHFHPVVHSKRTLCQKSGHFNDPLDFHNTLDNLLHNLLHGHFDDLRQMVSSWS